MSSLRIFTVLHIYIYILCTWSKILVEPVWNFSKTYEKIKVNNETAEKVENQSNVKRSLDKYDQERDYINR